MILRLLISANLLSGYVFGQTKAEVEKLLERSKLTKKQIQQEIKPIIPTGEDDRFTRVVMDTSKKMVINTAMAIKEGTLNYYGYNMFKRDPALFQSSVAGAVDPEYSIGPGDEIIIMLWGETQFRQVLTVDREGFIFIPQVGQVFVNGLNMLLLETKLFKVLSQKYSSLLSTNGNPTTFLDVSLGNLRPIRIHVVGEVEQPGAYLVSPSTTLFTSLYYFNGPTILGSLREVWLIRGGEEIASIDFYDYLQSGKKINDLRLQLDDTIFLPPRGKTVTVQGAINRPAIYELKEEEDLLNLLDIAGGATVAAHLERAQIDRIVPVEERNQPEAERQYLDVNVLALMAKDKRFELADGDVLTVFKALDERRNFVTILGNVWRPGTYELTPELDLKRLVELADGIREDTYFQEGQILRKREDLTQTLVTFDLRLVLGENSEQDLGLQARDTILIFNEHEVLNLYKTVKITGAVKKPGIYSYIDGMTFHDLILQAGSLAADVYRAKVEIARSNQANAAAGKYVDIITDNLFITIDDLAQQNSAEDKIYLAPYDVVAVRQDPYFKLNQEVIINGAVAYPGIYVLRNQHEFVSDIVVRAGGFTEDAYPEAAKLVRNKISIDIDLQKIMNRQKTYFDINVLAGDTIKVLYHPDVVYVLGAVNNPGPFKYIQGENVRDYIQMAGGFSSEADTRNVSVRSPSGDGDELKRFWFAPKVMDGSTIMVAVDTREPTDRTELAKEIASIIASLVTTLAIVYTINP